MNAKLFLFSAIVFTATQSMAQTIIAKSVVRKGTTINTTPVSSTPVYNVLQLRGKWQEIKRRSVATKARVSFRDTLQLDFNKRDSVVVRDKTSISQKGYAAVEGTNKLEVAGDVYTIVSLSKNMLVINDGEFTRELKKMKLFYHETLGTIVIPKEDLTDPVAISTKKISGKWDVYRTQATPGVAEDSAIIKHLTFSQQNPDGSVSGEVTYTKEGITESLPFKAMLSKGEMQLNTSKHIFSLYTYKADGKEFVFGKQGGLVYFAKQL